VPEVRAGGAELRGGPADGRGRAAGERGPLPGPGRSEVELGRFGKLHIRHGKGARGPGPRERMVPLINDAGRTLRWFIADVRGLFGDDYAKQAKLQQIQHSA